MKMAGHTLLNSQACILSTTKILPWQVKAMETMVLCRKNKPRKGMGHEESIQSSIRERNMILAGKEAVPSGWRGKRDSVFQH
jgi:hypothetical protein